MKRIPVKIATIMMSLVIALTFAMPEAVDAASKAKTPATPKITSCKVSGTKVVLKWNKAKNAKAYRVYVQKGNSKWKYWKKVKKNSKNKKKYSDTLKYKLKVSGKKYKVYTQANKYRIVCKKTTKRYYTYKGKAGTTYHFAVRAIKGKKFSKASAIKTAKIPKKKASKPTTPTKPGEPTDPDNSEGQPDPDNPEGQPDPAVNPGDEQTTPSEPRIFTITYNLDGGVNNPLNPSTFKEGTVVRLVNPTKDGYDFWGWFTDASFTKEIREIPKSTKSDLTVYAKWGRKAFNINGDGLEDMIWTWWYYPQVITEGTKTFWGYATKDGYCGVAMFDSATGETVKTHLKQAGTVDDHNGISLTLLDDKRIMCTYAGGHNSDNELHVRISDKPLDISSFKKDILLDSVGKTCYGQIIKSSGKYWLFYRINNNNWGYRSSPDGLSWSRETTLITASMQYYCKFMPTTQDGLIRILMYSNPAQTAPEIRMGFLDTDVRCAYNADGNTMVGEANLDYKQFDIIQDVEKGKTQRMLDVAVTAPEKPRFLIASFSGVKAKNDSVYYLCDAGKKFKICDGGKPLWDPKYQLGASFVDSNTIVAARHENLIDHVELYKYNGSTVTLQKTVFKNQITGSVRSGRPISDPSGKVVMWHYGYYNIDKYTDFNTSAILYFIDKNTLVGAPEQTAPTNTEYKITYELAGGTNHPENPATYISGTYTELKTPTRDGFEFVGWYADSTYKTNLTAITEDISGDLTLYAKWASKAMYIADADTSDMIWSWWTYPQVIHENGKIFWAYTTKAATSGVAVYNEKTGKISRADLQTTYQGKPNDTYASAITLTDDKRVVVAVPREEAARKMIHVYVSDSPLDISTFSTNTSVATTRPVTDCQLVKAGGLYYLFYRGEDGLWFYKTSDDAENWSTETVAIMAKKPTSGQYTFCCRFMPTTDNNLIRVLMQVIPGEDTTTDIRMGFLNVENGMLYNADAATELGNEKVAYSDFSVVQPVSGEKSLRLLDVAVTAPNAPKFIYADFTNEKNVNDSIYKLYTSGKSITICDGGKALLNPKAQLGACFAGTDKIVAARNSDGTDRIELYKIGTSAVTLEKELHSVDSSKGVRAARPISDANGKIVIWHQGTYSSATQFKTAAVLCLTGSGAVIGEPEPPVECAINYVLNGGTNNPKNPATYTAGSTVTIKDPTRTGFVFQGWFTDAGFTKPFAGVTAETTGDITVYAKWKEPSEYSITYNLNGGTNNAENPAKYKEGSVIVFKDPSQDGYTFKGWFTDAEFKNEIAGITAQTTGNITVYAKWQQNSIPLTVIEDEDMNDMTWSWWNTPQIITEGNKTFWTFTTKTGERGVACFDASTGAVTRTNLTKANSKVDTVFVALTFMDDKRIMCVCARDTDAKKVIHVHISDNPLDISHFSDISVSTNDYMVANSQLVKSGGKYYMFHRLNNKGSWGYWMSEDGETWTAPKVLVLQSDKIYFCRFVPTTQDNIIRVVMQSDVDAGAPEIRMGFINTEDGNVYGANGASSIGNMTSGRIANTRFDILQGVEEGKTQRLLDVAVTEPAVTRFIFASFTNATGTDDGAYYLYDSGSVKKICDEGKPLRDYDAALNPSQKIQLGASFAGTDRILAARSNGEMDYIDLYTIGESGVTFQDNVYKQSAIEGSRAARPISDASGKVLLWYTGIYKSPSTFDTSGMLYLKNSNTIVKGK